MRLGIPARPKKCIGKNVKLTPRNVVQKWIWPKISGYCKPDFTESKIKTCKNCEDSTHRKNVMKMSYYIISVM